MRICTVIICLLIGLQTADAGIIVTNWNLTDETLSFDIAGTIDPGASIGSLNADTLYIGDPGNDAWVNTNVNGNITNNASSLPNLKPITTAGTRNLNQGDYVDLEASTDFAVGDSVDASISFTFTPGLFNSVGLDANDLIVTAGFNSIAFPFPDASTQVGQFQDTAAVPEPSTWALMGLAGLGFGGYQMRKRKKQAVVT